DCGDVVKKPKLDQHSSRCGGGFDCIDCSTSFHTPAQWKPHTSCITEAEKYQKGLYKGPKHNGAQQSGPRGAKKGGQGKGGNNLNANGNSSAAPLVTEPTPAPAPAPVAAPEVVANGAAPASDPSALGKESKKEKKDKKKRKSVGDDAVRSFGQHLCIGG
ncbi:hypothetical protein K523DRAFT_236025, partial [Schizophyllum commune Tattone D]